MSFYDLSKEERQKLVENMGENIRKDLENGKTLNILQYASSEDVYIRKNTSIILGRMYRDQEFLRDNIFKITVELLQNSDEKVRQTSIYTLGEMGKIDAERVFDYLEMGLKDPNHKVRNSVMSALKQMGEKNPAPTLKFAKKFINDPDPEIRRKVIHGIELRGRTHPEDILPLLEEVQDEDNRDVRKMIIHVLGQISYKKGCLETVVAALKTWNNKEIVKEALPYIIEVHRKYPFSVKTPEEAEIYIKKHFKGFNLSK